MTLHRLGMASLLLLSASLLSCATRVVEPPPLVTDEASAPRARLYFMGDSQERELFGAKTWYSANTAQDFSHVAQRSLEQDMYSKFVVQRVVDRIAAEAGREGMAPTILHLGDLLDYSCQWEFENIRSLSWLSSPDVFVAPGNHDVVFQGNASYAGWLGAFFLQIFRGVEKGDLAGHHDYVCQRGLKKHGAIPPSVSARLDTLKPLPRYEGASPREHESNRELPNRFRCAYLDLKAGASGLQTPEVARYCDDVLFYSYFKTQHWQPLAPTSIRLDADVSDRYRAVLSGGEQFNNWEQGFAVQVVRVPLSPPGTRSKVGSVAILLLDTTDWLTKPSYGLAGTSDAATGNVSDKQWEVVTNWLNQLTADPSVSAVMFAGHYPLKDLSSDTIARLEKLVSRDGVLPLYLSAHTHTGYATTAGEGPSPRLREINVGSLIDNELHYRDLDVRLLSEGRALSVRSHKHRLDEELCKEPSLQGAAQEGKRSALNYISEVKGRLFESDEAAWCSRLSSAAGLLAEFAHSLIPMTRQQCLDGVTRLPDVLAAETAMINALNTDEGLRNVKTCQAIGGAEAFRFDSGMPPEDVYFQFTKTGRTWVADAEW